MMDDFDNSAENEELEMESEIPNTANLSFEEYTDCFGEPREVMKKHLLCNMCGGHLHFSHLSDFPNGLIQETSRCPDCGVRIRQRLHKLQ